MFKIGGISGDNLEFEKLVLIGSLRATNVSIKELVIIGSLSIKNLLVMSNGLIIGNGYINNLIAQNLIIETDQSPLIINKLRSNTIYIIGGQAPVIIKSLESVNAFLRHAMIGSLKAKNIVLDEKSRINSFEECDTIIYNDPHVFIEDFKCKPKKQLFKYSVEY
jgi:hypothetical protein